MKARVLINDDESAVVIFTDGTHFHFEADGKGTTGYWVISPNHEVDKVVIYQRGESAEVNDVYVATYAGVVPSPIEGRYTVNLKDVRHVGTTDANWHEFAEGGQNPIRYVEQRI